MKGKDLKRFLDGLDNIELEKEIKYAPNEGKLVKLNRIAITHDQGSIILAN